MRQVLTNLIGNAIKFTQAGEISSGSRGRGRIAGETPGPAFEVSDTGDGIAADKLALVFQPFVQADTSTSRKYGGTGLGLAISSQLVALMGGDCGVSSGLDEGSTFWFTIAVHADRGRPGTSRCRKPSWPGARLIVDDNAAQREVLSEDMTDWGMSVSTADSGPAALASLRAAATEDQPFAVAVLDRAMPEMDGLALKDAIVERSGLHAWIVMMTGLGKERARAGRRRRGRDVASKPVHRDDLRTGVRVASARAATRRTTAGRRAPAAEARWRSAAPGRRQPDQPEGRGRDADRRRVPGGHRDNGAEPSSSRRPAPTTRS